MHFDLTINLGEVITWAMAIGAFCYAWGRLNQRVESVAGDLDVLREDFRAHAGQNASQFADVTRAITTALTTAKEK